MSIVFILALGAVILFVAGVSFLFHGYTQVPDADKVIAKDEYEELRKKLADTADESEQLKKRLDTLVMEIEGNRSQLAKMQENDAACKTFQSQQSESQDKIRQLEQDLEFLTSRADQQASQAVSVIGDLRSANQQLRAQIDELSASGLDIPVEQVLAEKEALQKQLDGNLKKIENLEAQLKDVHARSQEQLASTRGALNRLRSQEQAVGQNLNLLVGRIKDVETEFTELLRQKENQLQSSRQEAQRLNREIDALKAERQTNEKTLKERQVSLQQPVPSFASPAAESRPQDEELRRLKDLNQMLAEKEEMLMFELTKSRAKVMGLEKICHDLRRQEGLE